MKERIHKASIHAKSSSSLFAFNHLKTVAVSQIKIHLYSSDVSETWWTNLHSPYGWHFPHFWWRLKFFYVLSSCVFCCIYHIHVIHTCVVILLVFLFDHGNYVGRREFTSNIVEEVYKDMKIFCIGFVRWWWWCNRWYFLNSTSR